MKTMAMIHDRRMRDGRSRAAGTPFSKHAHGLLSIISGTLIFSRLLNNEKKAEV